MSRLVRLYPAAWRARYGSELEDLIAAMRADGHRAWRLALDVARGAGRERLRATRGRDGLLMVLWAWALTVVAGGGLQKTTEHATPLLAVAAVTAAVLVAAGIALALPATVRFLRSDFAAVREPALTAAGLSVVALLALTGLVAWASRLGGAARDGHDAAYAAAFIATGLLCAAALAGWTALAATLARRITLPRGVQRAQSLLAAAVALTLPAITIGAALTPASALQLIPTLTALTAATALAATGAVQALRA
jgi:hypothetical protein